MNFYELTNNHRSIRKYKSDLVEEEKLNRILNASVRASSSGNMQAYSIIVTSEKSLKQKLYEPHFKQEMVLEAPYFITFCADFHRMRRWLKLRNAPDNFDDLMSFMIASIDAILASQIAALAAESEGLGICYLGTTLASCDKIAKILKCPKGVIPVVGFSMGYPEENPEIRDRLPIEDIVHREVYDIKSDQQILDCYKVREESGWKRYKKNHTFKKLFDENDVSNFAQAYTKVKYTKESYLQYSENVRKCLNEQGFKI